MILYLLYVLLCVTLYPFKFCNHLDGEERGGCFAFFYLHWCLAIVVWLFLTVPLVCLQFVIVVFPDNNNNNNNNNSLYFQRVTHLAKKS